MLEKMKWQFTKLDACCQADQIGRLFAYWVFICLGQFIENFRRSPNFRATFLHGKSCA
jgi:predicted component of viral defense system (DUF524 family)